MSGASFPCRDARAGLWTCWLTLPDSFFLLLWPVSIDWRRLKEKAPSPVFTFTGVNGFQSAHRKQ